MAVGFYDQGEYLFITRCYYFKSALCLKVCCSLHLTQRDIYDKITVNDLLSQLSENSIDDQWNFTEEQ